MSLLLVLVLSMLPANPWVAVAPTPCWQPPVDAPVVEPYRAPPCTYCAGNRGIEYGPSPGQTVSAVAEGAVTFAGSVAGTRYVVVQHVDGIRATYGRLASRTVAVGDAIRVGQRIGTTTDSLYFGLRAGEVPVDPTALLGVRTYPTRLVPTDGTPSPGVRPGRLVCRNAAGER